jgi:hypothetical protein
MRLKGLKSPVNGDEGKGAYGRIIVDREKVNLADPMSGPLIQNKIAL